MMRATRLILTGLLAAASLAILPSIVDAQDRSGFAFGIGGGYGSADATCDECGEGSRENSGAAYFKGGYTLREQVIVGGEFNLWTKTYSFLDADTTVNMYNLSGTVTYYPQPNRGLFVKGGAGIAFVDTEVAVTGAKVTADLGKGPGLIVGGGYDIAVSPRVSITPAVNFWYGHAGDLKLLGETFASNWKQNVVDFTIGITFP
jgi:hypothetical protein